MNDGFRKAYIYVNHSFCGILEETDEGYEFAYDGDYLAGPNPVAVSLTLPLTKEPYRSSVLFPFFDGLIPEGWLLELVSRNWKINTKDRFGLLLVACKDAIGNVEVWEEKK